jgi:hypothetical protein
VASTAKQARHAAVRSIARELAIDIVEAERWCAAWQEFAKRNGGAQSAYFWDAGRGWIDAQRAMGRAVASFERPRVRIVNLPRAATVAARDVERAS